MSGRKDVRVVGGLVALCLAAAAALVILAAACAPAVLLLAVAYRLLAGGCP